jgi:hypothetical protein
MSPETQSSVPVDPNVPLVRAGLRTPRSAAIAGIVFSILLITSLWLLRLSIPLNPLVAGDWLKGNARRVILALNLVPFAGIAFMWFLGVLRDRLGAKEDKFFATVFLGSGLMFLGMMFVAASSVGGLMLACAEAPDAPLDGATFAFARAFTYDIMHIYAFKMAAVFMISTSTLALYTNVTARWLVLVGYAAAAFILVGSGYLDWVLFVFPCWVLLVSGYILMENMKGSLSAGSANGR